MVSIIMLVHNARDYTIHSIKTLKKTNTKLKYELIVVDNDSTLKTKKTLEKLEKKGYIDKIISLRENTMFARGNNIGVNLASGELVLLLNSDIEIRNSRWLDILVKQHEKGAVSYGVCDNYPHVRGDGYCFLIDKVLYKKYKLDENFEWWWSVTKLQAQLLKDGYKVKAIRNHNDLLFHYGGMSGNAWKNSKGMQVEGKEVESWFEENNIEIIEKVNFEKADRCFSKYNLINIKYNIRKQYVKMKRNIKNRLTKRSK